MMRSYAGLPVTAQYGTFSVSNGGRSGNGLGASETCGLADRKDSRLHAEEELRLIPMKQSSLGRGKAKRDREHQHESEGHAVS